MRTTVYGFWGTASVFVLAAQAAAPALAQQPFLDGATVLWTVSSAIEAKPGTRATLVLHGAVKQGWHVYALKQLQSGPTPLLVALDANDWAVAAGKPGGSAPTIAHDSAFGFDTPYYVQAFEVTVPVRIKSHLAAGLHTIPVSVRFQTCNGQTCQPPKTVHLSAPVTIRTDA